MARSKSSSRWLKEHFDDAYVKRAQEEGWRSRAAFKLDEILARQKLLESAEIVVDLGAAPGSWSQLARARLGGKGRVIALDILPMQQLPGVEFIQGDFREDAPLQQLEDTLAGNTVDLVLSDMAPNMSGVAVSDQARAMHLAELALGFAGDWLPSGGTFVVKLFQGAGFDDYLRQLRAGFRRVTMQKPDASRARSNEVYALALGKY